MAEPISQAEAKLHLKVDGNDDNDLIDSLIVAARQVCEANTWRGLVPNGAAVEKFDSWPATCFRLKDAPLISVTSIAYIDANGDSQTMSSDDYDVDTTTEPGQITLAYGATWPSARSQHHAITITYVSGYEAATDVPDAIKAAMKLLIGTWYDNRESVVVGQRLSAMTMPHAVELLLSTQTLRNFYGIQ